MAPNITESVIKFIALDKQLIPSSLLQSYHLVLHYIDSTFELQRAGVLSTSLVVLTQRSM